MAEEKQVGFVTMGRAAEAADIRTIGVGMLGYAFMGKAHANAYRKLAYMTWPPPLQPWLVSIAGRSEDAVAEAARPIVTKPTCFSSAIALLLCERCVEGDAGRGEVGAAHERERIRRPPVAVHPRVLPLDRERPGVADPVERPDHRLEVHVAVAGRDEVPAAPRLAEVEVPAEDRRAPSSP